MTTCSFNYLSHDLTSRFSNTVLLVFGFMIPSLIIVTMNIKIWFILKSSVSKLMYRISTKKKITR